MKKLLISGVVILGLLVSCDKSVEPVKFANLKVGLSFNGANLTSYGMRINTAVTEWNHILSPTKVIRVIVAKADGGTSINRDVTYAELDDLTFSLEIGVSYTVELYLASTEKYSYDGLVAFGKSDPFTVEGCCHNNHNSLFISTMVSAG